ncbi:hypothetical protein TTHERM_00343780 (macronuclear) [Tetrahymena thermophila SB210]|uniref:Kinase domain protein n=1 Tax=Tetrahymena thermophila (strain SB210) TaxID=312017 RepID=I7M8H3_TETTS|nr:hypothetical protein TTHERM_00343780 [Tetrahymena thermophila SB210]EAR98178.1 hypothetical protein TTHERM_00343780 [Tetrahymena thermophila SB210]|eukprot:XP_001018423.1 hypothetical protein TTHERM_00343780 [Tetrahymena thermophila SB210]
MGNIANSKKYMKQYRAKRKSQEIMLKQYIHERTRVNSLENMCIDLNDLDGKQIRCDEIPIIFNSIAHKEELVHFRINLQNNNIRDEGILLLFASLSKCSKLQSFHLSLGQNCIGDQGVFYLVQGLNQLKQLESVSLFLQDNQITSNGVDYFQSLQENLNLKSLSLSLSKNYIGIFMDKLVSKLGQCFPNIKEFELFSQNCELTNAGANMLANKLSSLKNLESLSLFLDNNSITDNGIISLVRAVCQFQNLKKLSLNLCESKVQDVNSYFSPLNVFSDKCVLQVLQDFSAYLKLSKLNFQMKSYNHTDYLNFLKNGFEALEKEQETNKHEMISFVESKYEDKENYIISI